jgi:hypothetical protein
MSKKKAGTAQALIEFALVIPIFIFLFMVFIDLGRAVFFYAELSNAVREGSRFAIVHSTCAVGAENAIIGVINHYSTNLSPTDMTVVITPSLTPPCPENLDNNLKISVSLIYRPITPGLQLLLGSSNFITFEAHSSALIAPLYQR